MKEKERLPRVYSSQKGFSGAKEVVEAVKHVLGLDDRVLAIASIWEKELGPLSSAVELEGIKNGTLYVEVSSNAHLQELTLRKKALLTRINQHFGREKTVKNIRVALKSRK